MADHILDAFFVARVQPAAGGTYGGSLLPVCRFQPTGMPVSKIAPSVEAAAAFCFPLGVESVKPSAYLVRWWYGRCKEVAGFLGGGSALLAEGGS